MSTPARIIAVGLATFLPATAAYVWRAPCHEENNDNTVYHITYLW